jgi:hypothetical protein
MKYLNFEIREFRYDGFKSSMPARYINIILHNMRKDIERQIRSGTVRDCVRETTYDYFSITRSYRL